MLLNRFFALLAVLAGACVLLWFALRTPDGSVREGLLDEDRIVQSESPEAEPAGALPVPSRPGAAPPDVPGVVAPDAASSTRSAALSETRERDAKPAQDAPKWSGRVLSDRGLPLEGATVTICSPPASGIMRVQGGRRSIIDVTMTTEADGSFVAVREKAREAPWVEVRARGYRLLSVPVAIEPGGGDRELGNLSVEAGLILAGQVVDDGGAPVEGARVRREVEQGGMVGAITSAMAEDYGRDVRDGVVETDAEGHFELPNEEPGPYAVIAEHPSYPRARAVGEARAGESRALLIRFERSATIAGRLSGFPEGKEDVKMKARLLDPGPEASRSEDPAGALLGAAGVESFDRSADVAEDGSFLLEGLLPGKRYELAASVSLGMLQRERCSERLEVESGETGVELTYDGGASVSMLLVDASSGAVLRDAELRHEWLGDPRPKVGLGGGSNASAVEVAADGTHTIVELRPITEPGRLRLIVRVPGYREHELEELVVQQGGQVELGTVALDSAGIVRVRVVDARTGDPVQRARVRLGDARPDFLTAAMGAQRGGEDSDFDPDDFDMLSPPRHEKGATDSEGLCELPGFYAEEATLEVKASKYATFTRSGLVLTGGGEHSEFVQLHRGGTVVVRVVDAFDQPAPRARVQYRAPGEEEFSNTRSRRTRADGVVRFTNLPAGEHAFRLAPVGEDALTMAMRAAAGDAAEEPDDWARVSVGNDTEKVVVLALPPTSRLEGRVSSNGRPVEGARVSLHPVEEDEQLAAIREFQSDLIGGRDGSGDLGRTDDGGRFELEEVAPGSYELRVTHPDRLVSEQVEIELLPGMNEVEVDLPSLRLAGRVQDESGRAIAGARLEVFRASENSSEMRQMRSLLSSPTIGGGSSAVVRSDSSGRFELEGLPAGTALVVEGSHPDFTPGECEPIELSEEAPAEEVVVILRAAGRLRVLAPDVEGPLVFVSATYVPEEGAEVSEDGELQRTEFMTAGRLLMEGLRPGTWRVQLQSAGGADQEPQLVQIRAGEESEVTLTQ